MKEYATDYTACIEEAKAELRTGERVAVKSFKEDLEHYDTIFVGYPNWWGDMPMAVYTWLESHDFTGKTIVPFCTHAGSGLGGTVSSIQDACPSASLLEGFSIAGTTAQNNQDDAKSQVLEWLGGLELQ